MIDKSVFPSSSQISHSHSLSLTNDDPDKNIMSVSDNEIDTYFE